MTTILEGLNCRKQRDLLVPTVGRFKLSEISNID
jgi:hypothetical protein